ncbi:ATP-dependent Clp protease adaptor ClpS [Miltoncostaea oceani]|uniref:ATP-dependent Clp protease adaptor ClpS n=1 Tax=Miltoncostaea oceani TaxID=2843216 RepID=UPI001C3C6537|nr:ATP-dependent Clp protease adaptor ClpS [Miltoncostaea oceani]
MSTQTPVRPDVDTDTTARVDRPWLVIVLNDDHNTFEGVTVALHKVLPSTSLERGLEMAVEIHMSGRAVVWSGHREPAELYHEQLAEFGLTLAELQQS